MPINPNEELTPETSQEAFTARTYDPMQPVPEEAETNMEAYIKYLYDKTQRLPEKPDTREEYFMMIAGQNIEPGSNVEPLTVTANGTYSEAGKAYSPVTVNVPLPTNANEHKSVTSYPVTDSANYPLPKCDVTVTDSDKCEVIVTTDNVVTEDSGVYIERQSGGGNRELDAIVGGSIVWNQLVKDTDTSCTVQSGHKYVLKQGSTYTVVISDGTAFTVDGSINDNVHDLTAVFGTTIADYIYSLEQATAGSGIAWLKSYGYLTEDYYGYTANKIESVSVARHITRGKNKCPINSGTITVGDFVTFDTPLPSGTYSFSLKATRTPSSNSYASLVLYDKDGVAYTNVIGIAPSQLDGKVVKAEAKELNNGISKVYIYSIAGNWSDSRNYTLSISDLQIEQGQTATAYEPYHAPHTYPINPITLRGIPKLNASNQLYYDGDRYEASGRVTRKYGVVDLGSLAWGYTNGRFITDNYITDIKAPSSNFVAANILTDRYLTSTANNTESAENDKIIAINRYSNICIRDSAYTDAATFKAAMSGVYLVYEKATPTIESTSPFEANQIVDANGTEEYIDAGVEAGSRDVAIPVGHETKYYNGKAYVKPLTAGTSDTVSMADMGIMPTSPMYISANGSLDVEYWKSNS